MKRKMKKAAAFALLAGALTAANSMTAFAGAWQKDAKGWWYQKDDGSCYKNEWQWIDGNNDGTAECYYFGADGYMLADTKTPDGKQVNADGAWFYDYVSGHEGAVIPVKTYNNTGEDFISGTYIAEYADYPDYDLALKGFARNRVATFVVKYDPASRSVEYTITIKNGNTVVETGNGKSVFIGMTKSKYGCMDFMADPAATDVSVKRRLFFYYPNPEFYSEPNILRLQINNDDNAKKQ